MLIVGFGGSVTSLIPLYTVGVFIAFTLSQSGMVRHWWRLRDEEPRLAAPRRSSTASARSRPASSPSRSAASKFALGAWVVLVLIPILIAVMLFIKPPVPLVGGQAGRARRTA